MEKPIDHSDIDQKIRAILIDISRGPGPYNKIDELHAKIKQLSELVIFCNRLAEGENHMLSKDGCISLQELLAFDGLKERIIYELRSAAIRNDNKNYLSSLFDRYGTISLVLVSEAIQYNRLDYLLKIIRTQIKNKMISTEHLENILEMLLKNKNMTILAEAIMVEFPKLISEDFLMSKYIIMGNFDLLQHYIAKHQQDKFDMEQTICHKIQEKAVSLNFDVANSLYKNGIDVFNHKIRYLEKRLSEESNILKIIALKFDITHIKNIQLLFWKQVINHGLLEQVIDMIQHEKPNDNAFIKALMDHLLAKENIDQTTLNKYKLLIEVIQMTYPNGTFDLECVAFLIKFNFKNALWKLLEKHRNEVSETKLTFIEEAQLIALKLTKINYSTNRCSGSADIAQEIGDQFSVNAPAKKIRLIESLTPASSNKIDDELKELRHCQDVQAYTRPSILTNIMGHFLYPLFRSSSSNTSMAESSSDYNSSDEFVEGRPSRSF